MSIMDLEKSRLTIEKSIQEILEMDTRSSNPVDQTHNSFPNSSTSIMRTPLSNLHMSKVCNNSMINELLFNSINNIPELLNFQLTSPIKL